MEFRLLGPFEAIDNGKLVRLGRRRQERLVLATLLIDADRLVSVERFYDVLWANRTPSSARSAVQTFVGRVRTEVAPYGVHIVTRGDRYLLRSQGHSIDVATFNNLANRAFLTSDPREQIDILDQALNLWRAPLLADLTDDEARQRLAGPLLDLWFTCLQTRAEAQLAVRQHSRVINELTTIVEQHPTREALVGSLMTALYRASRQADALRLYETTRTALIHGLGAEPGRQLRELHRRILRVEHPPDQLRHLAYEVQVHGEDMPWTVGDHPALDFCNTYAGWHRSLLPGTDWLPTYRTLAVWAGYVNLIDAAAVDHLLEQARWDPGRADDLIKEALALRDHLYRCLTNANDEGAFKAVARHAELAAQSMKYTRSSDGRGRWQPNPDSRLHLPLHAVAWSAAALLADPRRLIVRACANPRCGWLFFDETGARRRCNLATCGQHAADVEQ